MRRVLFALFVSAALHSGLVAGVAGLGWLRSRVPLPLVTLQSIDVEVKSLPLGPPKQTVALGGPNTASTQRKVITKLTKANTSVLLPADGGMQANDALVTGKSPHHDAGASNDGMRTQANKLRDYGPEGSTLIALLRIDRLRKSPQKSQYIAAIDQLLLHLPDRHRLVEGTGLDIYHDFDSLLIATPDPTNAAVTFLAVRHRLSNDALKKALNRGAASMGQSVAWKEIEGRPVGIRRWNKPNRMTVDGDDRIFVLLTPSLAIMATPAHAKLILGNDLQSGSQKGLEDLVSKIDAEDGAMPEDAVFMMVANQLFANADYTNDTPAENVTSRPLRITANLPGKIPEVVTLVAGITPAPTVDLIAEFSHARDARLWEQALPLWRQKIRLNPLLLLLGFSNLINRIEVSQEDHSLHLHLDLTAQELGRLLTLIANLNRGAFKNSN